MRKISAKTKAKYDAILKEAEAAGTKAANEKLAELQGNGPAFAVVENSPTDGIFYNKNKPTKVVGTMLDVCGFAWTIIENARTGFAQYLKSIGRASNGYRGGMTVYARTKRQEMSVNVAYARAVAKVFTEYGFSSYIGSRID